jgi:uncharacterized protein (DUF302 family)
MIRSGDPKPVGVNNVEGSVHKGSPLSVAETVDRLSGATRAAGATIFAIIDHSGEAERVGLALRNTKVIVFGSPAGGTPAMVAAPFAAIDLPLRIQVWQDDEGTVWMSYLSADWIADRHGFPLELAAPLNAADKLTEQVAA